MANQQLVSYINEEVRRKVSKEQIKTDLLAKGWPVALVDEAFNSPAPFTPMAAAPTPPPASAPVSLKPLASQAISLHSEMAPKGLSKKMWLVIGIVAFCLLAGGGGAYGYFGYYLSSDRIMGEMMTRWPSVTTAQYTGNLAMEIKETAAPNANELSAKPSATPQILSASFSGSANMKEIENASSYFSINIKANELEGLPDTSFGMDVRSIGTVLYLKLATPSDGKGGAFDFSALNDKWVSLDLDAIQDEFDPAPENSPEREAASKKVAELQAALKRHQLLEITGQLPAETINEVPTFHFSYVINLEEARKLVIEAREIMDERKLNESEIAEIAKALEGSAQPSGELWIGKKDYMPYKMTFKTSRVNTFDGVTGTTVIDLTLFLSKFNEPVVVEKPEAITFQEAFGLLMGSFEIPTSFTSDDLKIDNVKDGDGELLWGSDAATTVTGTSDFELSGPDADKDGLPDEMEELFGTDPKKADTDGDGFNDYSEIENGYNPLGAGKL